MIHNKNLKMNILFILFILKIKIMFDFQNKIFKILSFEYSRKEKNKKFDLH